MDIVLRVQTEMLKSELTVGEHPATSSQHHLPHLASASGMRSVIGEILDDVNTWVKVKFRGFRIRQVVCALKRGLNFKYYSRRSYTVDRSPPDYTSSASVQLRFQHKQRFGIVHYFDCARCSISAVSWAACRTLAHES